MSLRTVALRCLTANLSHPRARFIAMVDKMQFVQLQQFTSVKHFVILGTTKGPLETSAGRDEFELCFVSVGHPGDFGVHFRSASSGLARTAWVCLSELGSVSCWDWGSNTLLTSLLSARSTAGNCGIGAWAARQHMALRRAEHPELPYP